MVKLGWFLVPKWLDLNKVFVDNDHIDILVKGNWIRMILSLSLALSLSLGQCAQGAIAKITSYSGDLARKLVTPHKKKSRFGSQNLD